MVRKVWLEAALNGPWGKEQQPNIPVGVDECIEQGIACAEAGAAIIHVHSYDEDGNENHDAEIYSRIIEGIQDQTDAIVYPSVPLMGKPGVPRMSPEERYVHQEYLGENDLLEWAVVDPGSVNFSVFDDIEEDKTGFIYENPEEHIRKGLSVSSNHGSTPSYAIYEPGFVRLGAALEERFEDLSQPIYRFMFSEKFSFGYPPKTYALESYLKLLREETTDAPWMVSGLGVDISVLIPEAVEHGGHVRIGLEDAPLGSERTNVEWVEHARKQIEDAGGTLATASEVRSELLD